MATRPAYPRAGIPKIGSLRFTATLVPRGPAAAVVLDDDPVAGAAFERLAYTRRKEYATWIDEPTRDETVSGG